MRVLVNHLSALRRRTGVGHHVAELVRCLRQQAGDQILTYPGPLSEGALAWWQRRKSRPVGSTGRAVPAAVAEPGFPRSWLKAAAHGLLRLHFGTVAACQAFDLYHEPNHIPLPCSRPRVVTIHDLSVLLHPEWHPPSRARWYERHFRDSLTGCAHFLTVSETVRRELVRHLRLAPEQITCTPNGIRPGLRRLSADEVARTRQRLGLPAQYLLSVGTLEPRKNLLMLLKAYCRLPAALRDRWPLLLVGGWGWNTADLAEFFHSEARHRGVLHVGYVADADLAAVYSGARALLFPSFYEGFGLPPVEMMACGGAVLASTAPALAEVCAGRAHLLDPHDQDGWHAALARIVQDDDWLDHLQRGVEEAARQYTWERCAEKTLAVYRRVLGIADSAEGARRAA